MLRTARLLELAPVRLQPLILVLEHASNAMLSVIGTKPQGGLDEASRPEDLSR